MWKLLKKHNTDHDVYNDDELGKGDLYSNKSERQKKEGTLNKKVNINTNIILKKAI